MHQRSDDGRAEGGRSGRPAALESRKSRTARVQLVRGQASTAIALRRAGIGHVEVVAGDTPAELRPVVDSVLGQGS